MGLKDTLRNICRKPEVQTTTLESLQQVDIVESINRSKKALLMGLNYTGTQSALNGCENDIYNIRDFLIRYGYEPQNIRIMTEDKKGADRPTRANMINAIKAFVKNSDNHDLFFHYSGHGSYKHEGYYGDEEDRRDECLCPLDYARAGMIKDDEIKKILVDPLKKNTKLTVLMDCCHSGSICDLKYRYKIDMGGENSKFTVRHNRKNKETAAQVVMISGCMDKQTSADYYGIDPHTLQKEFQGAMTNAFLNSMKDLESSGKRATYKRVMKGITGHILRGRFTQRSQFSTGYKMDLNAYMKI
jgi:hypothetical protein